MGMFAKGLLKGLTGSIDRNLQMALSRRQDDVSRAKTFWMTRQAQKLDAAEEHDRMAEKHLNRLINEFGGDVAKGLAAYKAIGGDVDTVGAYLKDVDETRRVTNYNLVDKFKFDGIDLGQFADLSKKQALSAVGMDVKPLDIQYTDTSGLAKLGLGLKDAGKNISDSINQLIPARDFTEIRNLTNKLTGKFDTSGLKASLEFKMQQEMHAASMLANKPNLEKQLSANVYNLLREKDPLKKAKLIDDNTIILKSIEDLQDAKDKRKNAISMSGLASIYTSGLKTLATEKGYSIQRGEPFYQTQDKLLEGQEALNKFNQDVDVYSRDFLKNSVLSADGKTYRNSDTQELATVLGLREMAESMIATANETIDTEGEGASGDQPPPTDDPAAKFKPEYVNNPANDYANAKEFLQFAETQMPAGQKMQYQNVINNLTTNFGLPLNVAERLAEPYKDTLEDIVTRRTTDNTDLIKALQNRFGADLVADDGRVMKRPTLSLGKSYRNASNEEKEIARKGKKAAIEQWNSMFKDTHKPDGTLKTFR